MSKEIIVRPNFYLSKALHRKNLMISIKSQGFSYDHDELLNAVYSTRFAKGMPAHNSWENYGFNSKTKGFPNWAAEFVKVL
jgi:hypothetical protein